MQLQPKGAPCEVCGEWAVIESMSFRPNPLMVSADGKMQAVPVRAFTFCLNCGNREIFEPDERTKGWRKILTKSADD